MRFFRNWVAVRHFQSDSVCVWVPRKTHTLKNWPIYGRYGHIPGTGGQIHTCSPGRLQGHLWVILTIGSCFYGSFWLFSVLGSGLLPHTRSKTLKTTVFLTQNTTFWPIKGKKTKKSIFPKVHNFLSHDAGDCQMACLYSEWGLFGRQKRTWATWGKTTTYPHDAG